MPLLQTSTLSDQNISSALLVGTYTATREILAMMVMVLADQIAGNGNYTVYMTRQLAGAGSAYEYQGRTTQTVVSGVTAIAFQSDQFPVSNGDVIKVYLVGLAGDTTTPDIKCEFWEVTTLGAGAISWPITITEGGLPVDGVDVWVTTDEDGENVVARGTTNDSGIVTFLLDAGTYYCWSQLAGHSSLNGEAFTVEAA